MNLKLEMTSREIADLVQKKPFHVKRDIEAMFEKLGIDKSRFGYTYLDELSRQQTDYRLDKDLTMTLVTKYDDGRRYAVVRRWRELEEQTQGRALSIEEVLKLNQQLIEQYRNEASDKTERMMLAKNLAAALSDRRKGLICTASHVNHALIAMGFMQRATEYVDGAKRYFNTLTDKGRPYGRVSVDTPSARSLEWRQSILPHLQGFFNVKTP